MNAEEHESDIWTIGRMLSWMQDFLEKHSDDNPRISAQWLISDATGLSRTELFMQLDKPLSSSELDTLRNNVKKRATGEPLQYITGEAPFRYLTMRVKPGVLIPRPETEVLVSETLSELPKPEKIRSREFLAEIAQDISGDDAGISDEILSTSHEAALKVNNDDAPSSQSNDVELVEEESAIKVVDLCTGSGCVALSLAYEHPEIKVIATDVSPDAVCLAKENAEELGLEDRVIIIESDLGCGVDADWVGHIDAVVSNPPYVPSHLMAELDDEVSQFEPALALDGGQDGLDVFRRIVEWSYTALKPNGLLAVELHEECLDDALQYAEENGFCGSRTVMDLAGKPRVLITRKADSK